MIDVALRSLLFDRGKLIGSMAGVALATTLLLVEIGLYVGLVHGSSALVRRIGGDVWLVARGTEVVDNGDKLPAGSDAPLRNLPCATRVRAVVLVTLPIRKPSGAIDYVQVVGADALEQVDWPLVRGAVGDLHAPLAVAVDEHDLGKLQIAGEPLGATLSIAGTSVRIAALTRGIRAFSLNPYVFTDIANARRIAAMGEGEAHYFVADVEDRDCASALLASFPIDGGAVEARSAAELARMTERFWIGGSGAGDALAFSALFSLAIGAVIVGQTLYAITKEHTRELATLRAMGGSRGELVGFVAIQASSLALAGGAIGAAIAFGLRKALSRGGIEVALSAEVLGLGAIAVSVMCVLATIPSALRVLRLGPAEVLR